MVADIQILNSDWSMNQINFLWSGSEQRPENFTDLEFRCKDGIIQAHGAYLRTVCPVLRTVSADFVAGNVTLVVPGVKVVTVEKFLELVYTGSTRLENASEFKKINDFGFEQLGFPMTLNKNVTIDLPSPKKDNQCLLEMSRIKTRITEQGPIDLPSPKKDNQRLTYLSSIEIRRSEQGQFVTGNAEMQDSFSGDTYVLSNIPQHIFNIPIGIEQKIDLGVETFESESNNDLEEDISIESDNEGKDIPKTKKKAVPGKQNLKQSKEPMTSSDSPKRGRRLSTSQIICSLCHEKHRSLEKLRLHYREVHSITKPFKCKVCDMSFTNRSTMLTHHRLVIFLYVKQVFFR